MNPLFLDYFTDPALRRILTSFYALRYISMACYQQFFYLVDVGVDSGDIGPTKHAQIAKATLNLQLLKEVVLATCCGGYNISEAPEIALVIPSGVLPGDFTAQVEKALAERGLDATVTLKDDIRYYTFTDEQLANIANATCVDDMDEAYRAVDRMCAYDISKGHDGSLVIISIRGCSQLIYDGQDQM